MFIKLVYITEEFTKWNYMLSQIVLANTIRLFPAKEKTYWWEGQSINDKNRMLITVEAGGQVLGGLLYYALYFMYV